MKKRDRIAKKRAKRIARRWKKLAHDPRVRKFVRDQLGDVLGRMESLAGELIPKISVDIASGGGVTAVAHVLTHERHIVATYQLAPVAEHVIINKVIGAQEKP